MSSRPSTAIVWFRRELRVHDLPALHDARADHDRVVPVFVLDPRLIGGRFASGPRTRFMLDCLAELDDALGQRNSGLVVREGDPATELVDVAREAGADAVLWTSDAAPYARARDRRVTEALREAGIEPVPCPGSYCADVSKPRTGGGKPYAVFTPFSKVWETLPRREVHGAPRDLGGLPSGLRKGRLPSLQALGLTDEVPEPVVAPGERAARAAMHDWLRGPVDDYADLHDRLSGGTSVMSPYLRWGCVSPREMEVLARERDTDGARAYVRQLAWRDFYAHVLLHHPDNLRHEYQERFRKLSWDDDEELLDAWREGRTGFPIVDAGMRQLARTGWMHNRARMVVGSFLTKDLHLDWRAGEAHFERLLLDAEPSQNNGNWQWIASTGVDPAPYFRRIFNPVLQSKKFDPDGDYLRRWVPELADVPDARIHEPWTMSDAEQERAGCVIGRDYPSPVVDHKHERQVAMDRYRAVGEG
ncbi:cryptochrome/photolyase family protein [Paraconexibacter algicola]|uniref:Deoxyribodipyrimidine photo-lyase n=1 Tax=Paraconexibacter algicola TaxID=2133960 RepID=A0A2T4UNL6_9ACTN|nr:deoxyribodipyrimidine photo-lyase [Paraconexibacter algicola]PTL60836.1 deoxyribodipyrimidine photo-lyase [Paraconexibacter algicola]